MLKMIDITLFIQKAKRHFRKKRAQRQLANQIKWLKGQGVEIQANEIVLLGLPIISKYPGSHIKFGNNLTFISTSKANPAGINHPVIIATRSKDSEIIIEDNVGMSGVSINCVNRITIMEGAMLGANVNVWDTDSHPISPADRLSQTSILEAANAPITIEKNVWIGANTTILKGVTIGENTVVGAMSLVNKSLPANSLCAGIPARKIKDL